MTTIVEYPTKSLKEVSKKVSRIEMMFNSDLTAIIGYMRDLVIKRPRAVGIAAPQIGYNKRIIIVRTNNVDRVMINPEIIERSGGLYKSAEGCLSIPNVTGNVQRDWGVLVKYTNDNFQKVTEMFTGFDSFVIQHEVGHLNGELFTDLLTGGDKKRADKKLKKMLNKHK